MNQAGDDQRAVIAALSDPATYGLHDERVERLETHCSIVFLAGDRAYKLKRAIRYAALDYTTRALRRAACEAELRLNRRTAPDLYLAMEPVTREPDGTLALNGAGIAEEYVVVMRRFAQPDLFDAMLGAGRLTPALMRELGETIARFHLAAEVTPEQGGSNGVRRNIASNDLELAKVASDLDGAAVTALSRASYSMLDSIAPLLDRRRAAGKVRRCHGDLRLANICLYAGHPTLFDCIEFSEAVGCADVLHDLAFLLMDLAVSGRGDLANVVFNSYLDVAPETEGLRALPLFLALRAATRAYLLAGSAHRLASPADAARRRALAQRHIEAGIGFLAPPPPRLVVVAGPGRRRTECAAALAGSTPAPGARILRPVKPDDAGWTTARAVAAAKCPIVLEGAFTKASERAAVQGLAAELALPWTGVWVGTPPAELDLQVWRVPGFCPDECPDLQV